VLEGDLETARTKLGSCFSLLAEARAHFYPVDAYLVDLTLVAPTTLGESLRKQLASRIPLNLVVSGETIRLMAQDQPETLKLVREALEQGRLNLIGGEEGELDLPLLPREAMRAEIARGLASYERHLERRPEVYGRRKYGLSAALPGILNRYGFIGALHFALDDGKFPQSQRSKTRWEGEDSAAIDAIGRVPLDANLPKTFLALSDKMGHTMDSDHVATLMFAHWPNQYCEYYDDLRRMAQYAPALGRFLTINEYFHTTDTAGTLDAFRSDDYRVPYLQQAVIRRKADPLSTVRADYLADMVRVSQEALCTLAALLTGKPLPASDLDQPPPAADSAESETGSGAPAPLEPALAQFAAAVPREKSPSQAGLLLANPTLSTRRIAVDIASLPRLPAVEGAVKAVASSADGLQKHALVEIPPLGFAWVGSAAAGAAAPRKPGSPIASENLLVNEFMQVAIHSSTGGIRSIHDFIRRGNRMSQQLSLRIPGAAKQGSAVDPDENAIYSVMALDDVKITAATSVLGEITTRGRLMHPEGRVVATYRQVYRLWQDSRVVWIDVELEPQEELRADPWNSYYASRFAWPLEHSDLHRSVQQGRQPTEAKRLEAPLFVDVQEENSRTSLLMGGMPYHRRIGTRMLDTLLLVKGESTRKFRLGIGIDLPVTLPWAQELILPPLPCAENTSPPAPSRSAWLFRADGRNLLATHWEALFEEGRNVGFRARLLETEGNAGRLHLRCFRPPVSARRIDFQGLPLADLVVSDDKIQLDLAAHEWVQIEARWKT
jgi:alpha-mannosidase